LDALSFQPPGHIGECLVHRGAWRTLLGFDPSPDQCLQWFGAHRARIYDAAADKIKGARLGSGDRFHLSSRDISRAWVESPENGADATD
jgi:hypothetical protein